MKKYTSVIILALLVGPLFNGTQLNAQIGTWTQVATNAPTANLGVTLLLTDGTVICHNSAGGTYGTGWNKLTPNATGSYVNGTWSTIASMTYPRLFFSSQVLPSGEVYVAGGEYGTGGQHGEVYNPTTNTWTVCGNIPSGWNIYDAPSELLYTGNILEGPEIGASGGQPCNSIEQWSPTTLNYTTETKEPENHDEAQWIKLPDSSVLTIGMPYPSFPSNDSSCRFLPKTNTWLVDAQTPNNIYDEYGFESGPGFLLPNGKAIFFGATKYNVIYTPTGHATVGSWAAAANFPTIRGSQVGQTDAPGAMMVNGHILLGVSPAGTRTNEAQDPIYFIEYNYSTNTFTQVTSPIPGIGGDSIPNNSCFQCQMLDLPDGTVLMSISQSTTYSKEYWVYTPGSAAISQGKPTINSILPDGCPNYKITGKLFNGISEGSAYGDDWQNATNYPLVRLTKGTNVYYAKTTNWNRIGAVQTDSLEDTVVFTPPALPAGTYSLVVVANGFASNPVLFSVLGASISSLTNSSCGGNLGSATVSASGGILPYTYSWSPGGATGATASNLNAGTYTVNVKDNNGCSATVSATITQPVNFTVTASTTANESCYGGINGSTSATVSGGTAPYTYSWIPAGGSSSTASGLSAGTYTLNVIDNGCTATASVTITQPPSIVITTSVTPASCGGSNGEVTATISGGTSPYTYFWSEGGGTNSTASNLGVGTYSITVTDSHGCTATASATITEPPLLSVSADVTTYPSCLGGNGSVSASLSGGTSPYTYSWTGGSSNSTETGLSAGTYTVTIKDINGCSITASTTLTQPAFAVGITISSTTNINCTNVTGSIIANTATGGTSPYTYSWSPAGGSNLTASGLSAGSYTITVKDNHGCTATASATITQSTTLSVSATTTVNNSNCAGNSSGSVSATPSGGTSPYTYSWTGGSTTSTESALSAGTYTITLTDKNNCTATASATITQPALLGVAATVISYVSCTAANNGSISANASGGVIPYTYSWTGGSSTSTLSGLSAGTYTITLKDNSGCIVSASAVITQPLSPVGITISSTSNINCNTTTGTVIANTATGGTSPYTYSWSPAGGSNLTASGLSAGSYTITVTDNHGCTATASASITQSATLTVSASTTANNTSCAGENGSVYATPSGGTSPYTYSWTGGSTVSSETALSAGTYTITLTDKNGCIATSYAIVTQAPSLNVSAIVTAYPSCLGSANGSISATPSGGVLPYTYSWTGGSSNSTISALSAGVYTITVEDYNACTAIATATLTQPATPVGIGIFSITNITCNGGTGSITAANATGGFSPYTYSWSSAGGTNLTSSNLSAGTYTIMATDNHGCTASASATVTQSTALTVSASTTANNTSCTGGNGSVFASVSGGTSPYTYSWTGGSSLSYESGLSAGIYTVTTIDKNGCTNTSSATVTQPAALGVSANTTGSVHCYGANNGSVSASPSGGTSPYTYSWTGGSSNSTGTGLSAGTYTIAVTDKNGCSATASANITQPSALIVAATTMANNTGCTTANGSVSVSPSGGTPPYTYSWTGGSNTSTESGLASGTYSVTLTDNNGCSATASTTVTQSPSLSVTASTTSNANCNGSNNGSVSATLSGGTSPYTYSWTGGNTNSSVSGLSAGTYTITLKDNNGCMATASTTITQSQSSVVITRSSVNNILCYGGNGSASANPASGGVSPYTYSWSPGGGTNLTTIPIGAGTFTITATDNNGCTATVSATITQPSSPLGITIFSISNPLCNSGNGSIIANSATGGTSPYTYSWSPTGGTNLTATVSAGSYTIMVIDNNGCNAIASVVITQPSTGLGITIETVSNILCYGGIGNATANAATGGTSPYTYSWLPVGGTNQAASALSAGTYTIVVTDIHGCSASNSATITQPSSPIGITISTVNNILCNGGSGSIIANTASGGTLPYTYSWSSGAGTNLSATVSAGTYTITVTDNHGCNSTAAAAISQPAQLGISATTIANNTSCNGTNGSVSASPSGGTFPYTYSWTGGSITSNATGLSAGTYTITLTDNNGCTATSLTSVSQTASLALSSSTISNVSCYGGSNGQAEVTASGGSSPYTYSWSPSGGSAYIVGNLSAGIYSVTVIDINGCSGSSTATVTQPSAIRDSLIITNPTCSATTGSATAGVKGGTSPYTYSWNPGTATTATVSGLSAGTYTVTIKDAEGCSATASGAITLSHGLSISTVIQNNVSCYGGTNGIAKAGVSGGVAPYTYSWTPGGSSTYIANNVSAGTYTVTITDKNGCNSSATATITQPAAALSGNANITYPNCVVASGSATIGVSGGTPPYTYTWSPSISTTSSATGLTIRSYVISLKDAHGCTTSLSFSISQPPVLRDSVITSLTTEVICGFANSGSAKVGVKYGTLPYTYSWANGSTSVTASGLSVGTYSVTVKDANTCSASATVTITQAPGLTITTTIQNNVSCNSGTNGIAKAAVSGGTPPYTYSWSPGGNLTYLANNLTAGTYTVSVTDKNGCNNSAVAIITQPAAIRDSMAYINNATCYAGTGNAGIGIKGGTPPYVYTWSPPVSTTATATGLTARSYVVSIKDADGCTASLTFTITQPLAVRDSIVRASTMNLLCNGSGTGNSTVGAKYGTQPYTYSWSNGNTSSTASNMSAGTYTVTVKDGCGNSATATVSITQPNALRDSISSSSCTGGLVTATVGVRGGVAPYTYSWSPGGGTKATMSGLSTGTYTITVTDKNHCTIIITPSLSCGASPANPANSGVSGNECCPVTESVKLYPNPSTGQFTIQLSGVSEQSSVEVYNMLGRKVMSEELQMNNTAIDLSSQPNGIYLYRVLKEDGSQVGTGRLIIQK